FDQRVEQTEETSLKFSNLSQEELILWREGRPSLQLRYELSYWSDLAKWLLRLQEESVPYKIQFESSSQQLPNKILIGFPDLELGFYLSEANLPLIIPALATVKSPLIVHDVLQDIIQEIRYDPEECAFYIAPATTKALEKPLAKEGVSLSGWRF